MSLYKNKYRIEPARWKNWDYTTSGGYFVTICVNNRRHVFGICEDGQMQLNDVGRMANDFWLEIPQHFPNVGLGEFIIMPNHVHGIVIINSSSVETLQCNVSTEDDNFNKHMSDISPKPRSLSTIIRSYKSACTKYIRIKFPEINFSWQSRFHDRVIRNEVEYWHVANYINRNPINWKNDEKNEPNL